MKSQKDGCLNTVYRRKLKFSGHTKRHGSLEKVVYWKDKYLGKDHEAGREGQMGRLHQREAWIRHECEAGRLAQNRVLYRATVHAATS